MAAPSDTSRLHRRASSAALHASYTPLVGGPGDIASVLDSDGAFSSATPHARSVSLGYARVNVDDVDDDEKENDQDRADHDKDGLIPRYNPRSGSSARPGSGAGGWRSVPSSRKRRHGGWWKCKLLLLSLIAAAVGGLVWYRFFAPPATRETIAEVKDWWNAFGDAAETGTATSSVDPAGGTARVGWSGLEVDEIEWTTATPSASPSATRATASTHISTARPTSTMSRFAHVDEAIKNGSLAAYKWHAVLPPVEDQGKGGRVIVVGDIHGTHRSLLSLLSHLHFSPSVSSDILIHTGDLAHKSSLSDSLTTVSLLGRLRARGVRGNTDQRVIEWRMWMEAVGPLDLEGEREEKKKAGAYRVPERVAGLGLTKLTRPSVEGDEEDTDAPQPRRRDKRAPSWFGWLTGNDEAEFDSAEAEQEQGDLEAEPTSSIEVGGAKTSVRTEVTAHRRPFGRPTKAIDLSSSSASATRSSAASRPSATSSSTSSPTDGSLLGPLYAHLSPKFSTSRLRALNVPLPPRSSGLTWGSPEFELARHLPAVDFAYLRDLPLTLWVEELGSWVVHAGMVPRSNSSSFVGHATGGRSVSALASNANALLESANPRAFAPSSSRVSRLLSSSSKWSILLEKPNTDPWTLMNLRTLEPASRTDEGWKVSAKGGKKASRGSQAWWKVWEEEMSACAEAEEVENGEEASGCEEAGVVYGHWAGQGLQVHDHSVGLDTGCVYGRRLSSLVVPLSNSSRSSTLPSASHISDYTPSATATATTRDANPKAKGKANWHGGMQKIAVSAPTSSSSSALPRPSTSRTTSDVDVVATPASYDSYEEDELDFADSTPSPSASASSTASKKPWWRPWKRAPPQGRPGVAPWEGMEELQVDFDAAEADDEERLAGMTEVWNGGKKTRPTAIGIKTASSAAAKPTPTASSLSALLAGAADALDSTAFHERPVTLHNGRKGQIVSVDCAGEVEVD